MDIYNKQHNYLVFRKSTNEVFRWEHDNKLFFEGDLEDAWAMLNFDKETYEVKPVSECSPELQKEYEQRVDELIEEEKQTALKKTGGL